MAEDDASLARSTLFTLTMSIHVREDQRKDGWKVCKIIERGDECFFFFIVSMIALDH